MVQYLVQVHGFTQLYLSENESIRESGEDQTSEQYTFFSVDSLLDFVTKKWRARWVLGKITDGRVYESLSRRPFFLLASVDAPVSLRWNRHLEKF